jgi:hypothetical protein
MNLATTNHSHKSQAFPVLPCVRCGAQSRQGRQGRSLPSPAFIRDLDHRQVSPTDRDLVETGFVVACSCENERSATYMAMGSFLPIVMLCGIIWPIEGMHPVLRYISFLLPLTKSTESFRAMVARGWEIENPVVYDGFVATFVWIIVFLTLAILLIKFKKG